MATALPAGTFKEQATFPYAGALGWRIMWVERQE